MIYPTEISKILSELRHAVSTDGNAIGTDANFVCGCFIRFRLKIETTDHLIESASFTSNGCGYMVSNAEILAREIAGKCLTDLHGLDSAKLAAISREVLGECPQDRANCLAASSAALRTAFADLRSRQIEEFRGEKALVCTCFGVTEESIENAIETGGLTTVEDVSHKTNAGSGCGSCRMLIQEMLDSTEMG
ncbi:MAG: (2Fe-2S)-binding protein [Pyrinomonadaceae bacterium]